MKPSEITELVARVLAAELKTPVERVRKAQSLKNELGMDSIAAANAAFSLEEEFSVEIEIFEEDSFDTVDDIAALVRRALTAQ